MLILCYPALQQYGKWAVDAMLEAWERVVSTSQARADGSYRGFIYGSVYGSCYANTDSISEISIDKCSIFFEPAPPRAESLAWREQPN